MKPRIKQRVFEVKVASFRLESGLQTGRLNVPFDPLGAFKLG